MAEGVFNKLGQSVLPKVFDKLSGVGLTDMMDVKAETTTAGSGGGRIKSASKTVYCDIPVVWEARTQGYRNQQGDSSTSMQEYVLKFPTHNSNGIRYVIDPRIHRLVVTCRSYPGDEPKKTFRIVAIKDMQGNMYEADCIRENL